MSSGFSDVELVQQRTLIAENKSNSFTRLYVDAFRFEENIAHFDLHRTGNLRGDARLADVLFPMPCAGHSRSTEEESDCCDDRGNELSFHSDLESKRSGSTGYAKDMELPVN